MNPARSPMVTATLPRPGAERRHVADHLGRGDHGADHLDQLHDRCGVEEVHPDHLLGAIGRPPRSR